MPTRTRGRGSTQRQRAVVSPTFLLDASSSQPLHRQLYEALRGAILGGRLPPGARVPSVRTLADQLRLSRNTVVHALGQLAAEGYLEGRHGSGTFIATQLPEHLLKSAPVPRPRASAAPGPRARLSRRGTAIAQFPSPLMPKAMLPPSLAFRLGAPAHDAFPSEVWGRLLQQRWKRSSAAMLRHADARGYAPLREAIAAYLADARGVRCTAEQILIVAGTQQALSLVASVVIDPGDAVWVEDPGYAPARGSVLSAGGVPTPVPVDSEGLVVHEGRRRAPQARLAIVTPSSQFPLVVTMSLRRRLELLEWARTAGAWILEDDYDSEYRYSGRPLASLQGLDTSGQVIYVGTFSKVVSPSVRVGYLVAPPALLDALVTMKTLADGRSPVLEQAVLADFLNDGHFARHIRRMRTLYEERQASLIEGARRELAGLLEVHPVASGLHLVGWLNDGVDDVSVAARAAELGIHARPLSACRVSSTGRGGLLLGYSGVRPGRPMLEGLRTLAKALE